MELPALPQVNTSKLQLITASARARHSFLSEKSWHSTVVLPLPSMQFRLWRTIATTQECPHQLARCIPSQRNGAVETTSNRHQHEAANSISYMSAVVEVFLVGRVWLIKVPWNLVHLVGWDHGAQIWPQKRRQPFSVLGNLEFSRNSDNSFVADWTDM